MAVNSLNPWQICLIQRTPVLLRLDHSPAKGEVAEARLAAIKRSQECLADSESSWRRRQGPTKWPEPSAKEQEGSIGQLLHYSTVAGALGWLLHPSWHHEVMLSDCLCVSVSVTEREKWRVKVIVFASTEEQMEKNTHKTSACLLFFYMENTRTRTHTHKISTLDFSFLFFFF